MPKNQFDRYATSYSENRDIQNTVAQRLLEKSNADAYNKIIDVGCGDGAIFEKLKKNHELFVGVDASKKMCELHGRFCGCTVVNGDFDDLSLADKLAVEFGCFDLLLSSSSLQWSSDIGSALRALSKLSNDFAVSIFTNGTFGSLTNFLGINGFLPEVADVKAAVGDFCVGDFWVERYTKKFADAKEAMRYIKHTGISGGGNKIGYKEAKRLYEVGPNELEFEVVYVLGSFKKRDFSAS